MNMLSDELVPSTRPYLIRALFEWCMDCGYTPYLAVQVDATVQVPLEFVKNNEIVLNISPDATHGLQIGNEWVEFKARFGGVARDIMVPVDHVLAIYARENGQGMAFPAPSATKTSSNQSGHTKPGTSDGKGPDDPLPPSTRPTLTRIK
jgi:stringent starvation protein B